MYKTLAKYYDLIYTWKDYKKEVEFIEKLLKYNKLKDILDVGCGTGSHASLLIKRGFSVTGIDISDDMLKIARKKVKNAKFIKADMRNFDFKKKFDAIICMFTALNYNFTKKDLERTFTCVSKHLKNNGIIIFDIARIRKDMKIRRFDIVTAKDKRIELARITQWNPDLENRKWILDSIFLVNDNGKFIFKTDKHDLAILYPKDIIKILKKKKFRNVKIYSNFEFKKYKEGSELRPVFVVRKK
ncbi:MAG: class I SAM-dependent methyltransferase [Candidatus Aenigmatarchaeota archaeon]